MRAGVLVPDNPKTHKKIPCHISTQLAGGLLLKKLKYFEVMINIFEFPGVRIYRVLIGLCK